jgi:cell division protein FtsW
MGNGNKTAQNDAYLLLITTIALVSIGIVMVFSASAVRSQEVYNDQNLFLKRQMVYALMGLAAMLIAMRLDYHVWYAALWPLLIVAFGLLLFVLVAGRVVGGARRWIDLGFFTIQPSEIAKFAVLVYLASLLKRKHAKVGSLKWVFLPAMIVVGTTAVLVLAERDLGSPAVMVMTFLVLLTVAGGRFLHVFSFGSFSLISFAVLVATDAERRARILAFLDPWAHAQDDGFQLVQSLIGFGVGGIFGQGLGEGRQKLYYLPEAHTDFIFSVIGEELGLIGTWGIVLLYLLFVCLGLRVALRAKDSFGSFLAVGITLMIGFQALLNIAVVTGWAPTKGLTLPFISYGGNSLIISMMSAGVLMNIAAQQTTAHRKLVR